MEDKKSIVYRYSVNYFSYKQTVQLYSKSDARNIVESELRGELKAEFITKVKEEGIPLPEAWRYGTAPDGFHTTGNKITGIETRLWNDNKIRVLIEYSYVEDLEEAKDGDRIADALEVIAARWQSQRDRGLIEGPGDRKHSAHGGE